MVPSTLVSVVIPSYNRRDFLMRAVDSVLKQSWTGLELLVVDDGSDDGTEEMITGLKDDRLRFIRQEHRGVSAARNTGIMAASGGYVAFLDSDDRWRKRKLEKQLGFMRQDPDMLLSHTDELWYMNGRHLNPMEKHRKKGGDVFGDSIRLCVIGMSTVMVRREFFDKFGFFDEAFEVCEDYELFLRMCQDCHVGFLPLKLTLKDGGHADQLSRRSGLDSWRIRALVKLLDNSVLDPVRIAMVLDELERKCVIYGNGCIKRGREEEGRLVLGLPSAMRAKHSVVGKK